MTSMSRRDVCVALPALALTGAGITEAQVHASEFPSQQSPQPESRTVPTSDKPAASIASGGTLGESRSIPFDGMPIRTMANGGESRDIAHGTLATGEAVNLHESVQVAGATPNPPHVIQHSEFILVREGELEFQHEAGGQMVSEKVGPGGVLYVAYGTRHTAKNVGTVPAKYFVVAIGGDAK